MGKGNNTRLSGKLVGGTLALVCLLAGSAKAATVSYFFNYLPEGIPQVSHLVGTLPLFNPALGTLTQVDLDLTSNTSAGTIDWENLAGVPSDITLGIGASVTVQGQFGGLAATAVPMQIGNGAVTAYDGVTDFSGTSSFSVAGGSGTDSGSGLLTGGAVAPYVGVGLFNVDGLSSVSTLVSTTGGFGPTQFTLGVTDGLVTVTYTYTPVPEPGTLALLGLGLASLLAFRLRKRSA